MESILRPGPGRDKPEHVPVEERGEWANKLNRQIQDALRKKKGYEPIDWDEVDRQRRGDEEEAND